MMLSDDLHKRLEFDKIITLLKQETLSALAADKFERLAFMTGQGEIETHLSRVSELVHLLEQDAPFPLQLWDIGADLEVAAVPGGLLPCDGLIRIANTLSASRKVRVYFERRKETYPHLRQVAQDITLLQEIETAVADQIDFQASEVKSSASPKLSRLRKEIQRLEQKARKALEHLFKQVSEKGYLQEPVMTLKDGRLVFPVKIANKGKVRGLVHDQSASGATVFVEPLESIEFNNEIQSLRREEQREVERILRALTALIYPELQAIRDNLSILAEFDFIHAKARFARTFDCVQPSFNTGSVIDIIAGKHPLLLVHRKEGQEVVPLNLEIGEGANTLVITGPNAGGKSVALKTVGLLALMVQCGIPIPAHPDSTLPVFKKIFADIGDYQSIEQDLSTFTSHIKNIQTIVTDADEHSLVLLDEIGVGTDPDEGAALSIAVLEALTARGSLTIVTTHHGNLKAFAYNTPGVENGSMEFDVATLLPTFRFKAGIPGSSYALEISRRLGLPEAILSRSRALLGSEKHKLERLILDLDRKTQASERLARSLEIEKTRLQGLTNLYQEKVDSFKEEARALKRKALEDARHILDRSNAIVEQVVKEIKEKEADRLAITSVKERLKSQKDTIEQGLKKLVTEAPVVERHAEPDLAIGREVLWRKQNRTGKVIALQDDGAKALLELGNIKIWVGVKELAAPPERQAREARRSTVSIQTEAKDTVLPEIDVRGQTLDDATGIVDKFLDDALLAGWSQVRIIHGKGTGVLRKGLASFLDDHARVKSHKMGAWNEGDLGVTIAELD
ncbi:MAG: endonuclease MutS2 [bacterium]